jgi:predicted acyltransferase
MSGKLFTSTEKSSTGGRLQSIDALRGFDMFWIMGAEGIIHTLKDATGWGWAVWMSTQLDHVQWNGFRAYDLIFPLFLFLSGATMPFSLARQLEKGIPKKQIYWHVVKRGLILVLLGCIYNGLLQFDFEHQRYASVLAQIGIAYVLAAFIFLNTKWKGQVAWVVGIVLAYWAAMKLIPVPGFGPGVLTREGSLVTYLDQMFLPGRFHEEIFDPEGLLVKIPATATALLGALTGTWLKKKDIGEYRKVGYMAAASIVFFILAYLIGLSFPINKKLWSSSFVFQTAACSVGLMAIFYLIIDVWQFRRWAFFFIVIGMNPITIYMVTGIIDFWHASEYFLGGFAKWSGEGWSNVILVTGMVGIEWLFLYFLYKKKIFLKV